MRKRSQYIFVAGILAFLNSPATGANAQSFEELALEALSHASNSTSPAGENVFALNVDFPDTLAAQRVYPWESIDFTNDPLAYLEAVKEHILSDDELVTADFNVEGSQSWFHAPWLDREPIRGLTNERSSDPGELWPGQPDGIQNWAVSFYNERGGYTVGQVWQDPANPDASAARFPVGTVGFKLLFTAATVDQVPYLSGSKVWRALITRNGQVATEMRLLQVDIAVRDRRADEYTGWVFGTFMYYDPTHSESEFSWDRVVPATLTWGSDPELLQYDYNRGERPDESWTNPLIIELFEEIRSPANGFETSNLGFFGRANGPVDNPRSSCLACHSQAVDSGDHRPGGYWRAVLPFAPDEDYDDFAIQWFFRNLSPDEPFLHGMESLDYSLQLRVGIRRFRRWADTVSAANLTLNRSTALDVRPLRDFLLEEEYVQERGGPQGQPRQ